MSRLRTFAEAVISRLPARLQPMARWRFIKFGAVGASGTVINIAVLYLSQEFLLRGIADFHTRLNYSIALAITLATISNFYWNQRLTWRDRKHPHSALFLFAKYVMAAALSIAIQSLLTKWLAQYLHYIVANLVAIVLASVANFLANDRLTFRRHRAKTPATDAANENATTPSKLHDKP
ncbi:Putative flippase GtrA (transmembrane translocase of bactoprenol-linked glucose) [Polaromonas sp. OV174]|uniref:GtrA family protein n=1 Tax=Polaromonas sp. OV174 TaxID=1855300 RepID=UPI0008E4A76D|nr:GtrA family protein [Polaromonas sp. OV174]SFC06884.1 Putative flippase GtrA (transmembrane translocase of bactoprenol-linked glucose) [Polaromonas sp. OV174]